VRLGLCEPASVVGVHRTVCLTLFVCVFAGRGAVHSWGSVRVRVYVRVCARVSADVAGVGWVECTWREAVMPLAFLHRQDSLMGVLTVRETFTFAAELQVCRYGPRSPCPGVIPSHALPVV
jgi:hypothetical protein